MSANSVTRYIVTFNFHEQGLSEIQELNSAMVNSGFTTTLSDEEGHLHELDTQSFGLVSTLTSEEIARQATTVGESVLGQKPEVEVTTLEAFLKQQA